MTNQNLSTLILNDSPRIVEAISSGAAWELWMQVEMLILFRQIGGTSASREIPYPAPNNRLTLDFGVQDAQGYYAIELKVESATNAGRALVQNVLTDVAKLRNYAGPVPLTRWAVAIGYSAEARNAMRACVPPAAIPGGATAAIYNEANSIGVLVFTV